MEAITATSLFWFISLGLIMGWLTGKIIKEKGISLYANLVWGMAGAVISGSTGIIFEMGDGLLFAVAGTSCILFLVNVFHLHHKEDLFGVDDPGIRISHTLKNNKSSR